MASEPAKKIFFLLFDDVEVLDFSGSFDVFSMANLAVPRPPGAPSDDDRGHAYQLYTLSKAGGMVRALHGLRIEVDYSLETCPVDEIDMLIIPGASNDIVKRFIAGNPEVIRWIAARLGHVPVVASVCVGALILATAGGFDNRSCTTHHGSIADLEKILATRNANATVFPGARYIDNPGSETPRILSSAGVSAGIDQAFYILAKVLGTTAIADTTATIMEYNRTRNWMFG